MLTRRNALKLLAGGTAGCAAAAADAFWIEPGMLTVTRQDIAAPGLDGLRIGLLADFHFRPGADDALLAKVVARVNRENLDLVALAGDFIDHDPRVLSPLLAGLGKINTRHGVLAVMGNHDGWSCERDIARRQFERAGISFLINGHSILSFRGEPLAIAGTDFVWLGKPDPNRTLKGIPASTPVLALVHEPDFFDEMTAHRDILLQVSGHTHGGQCRIPFTDTPPATVRHGKKYIHGAFTRDRSNLFVTRGVGTTGPRVRFACPPELAVLTLRG